MWLSILVAATSGLLLPPGPARPVQVSVLSAHADRCAAPRCLLDDETERRKAELLAELAELKRIEAELEDDDEDEEEDADYSRRIDAALGALGRNGGDATAAAAAGGFVPPVPPEVPAYDPLAAAALEPGETVAVVGGATPIGRCVLRALSGGSDWRIRALVSAGDDLGDAAGGVEVASAAADALVASLEGAAAVLVISEAAGGKGGVGADAMPRLMAAVPSGIRRLVLLSSHGVERTDRLPFSLGNVWGQLDKLRAAEQEVQLRALGRVPACSVLRVGGVVDDAPATAAGGLCALAPGDALQGSVSASAAASALLQSLSRAEAVNATFSAGPLPPSAPGAGGVALPADAHWTDEFLRLVGPELLRRPLRGGLGVEAARSWLREWARGFLKEGRRLTSPVEIEETAGGATIRFVQRAGTGYAPLDKPETADDKWRAAAAAKSAVAARPASDGALALVAEAGPDGAPRLRVARAEMRAETVVKEMSEAEVLGRLEKDLGALERQRR